jgi:multiple sugar transport system substrate-binding protein
MKNFAKKSMLLFFVLLFVLSACAPKQAVDQPADSQQPAAADDAAVNAEEAESSDPSGEVVHLTFWNNWEGVNGEVVTELVERFNESHPGIVVENVFQPYAETMTLYQTSIVSGTTPDLAAADLIWIPQLVASDGVEPLDAYMADDADFDIDNFYPMLAEYDVIEGSRYAVPMSTNNMQLIWNKDLFEKAGLDPEVPPTTWAEMQDMAEQCADPDNGVVGFEFFTQPTGEGITWQFQVWLWAAGGEFLNADNTQAAFNTPEGLEALTYVSDMLAGEGSEPGPWGLFGEQKACMQLDGSWLFGYRKDAPFDWGIAAVPAPENGTTASNVGGEHIFMFKNTEYKAECWEFIKYMTSTEIQKEWDMRTGFLPVRESVGDSEDYLQWVNETEPRMMPFVEGMPYAHTRPATHKYNEISDAFSREIQMALLGEVTPQEALAAAEVAINEILGQ